MNKEKAKELINYIINDKSTLKNIDIFNDSNTYYSSISHNANFLTFPILITIASFFTCILMNFHPLAIALISSFILMFTSGFSAMISHNHEPDLPYIYYFFPRLRKAYIKKQKTKLRKLYKNNNLFYQSINIIKKNTKSYSTYRHLKNSKIHSPTHILQMLLMIIKHSNTEEEYITLLSSIVLELNIDKNKNDASEELIRLLEESIESFEEKLKFKKTIVSYSDSQSNNKNDTIDYINKSLKKIKMIKKL